MTKIKNMQKRMKRKKNHTDYDVGGFYKIAKKLETEIFAFSVITFEPIKI